MLNQHPSPDSTPFADLAKQDDDQNIQPAANWTDWCSSYIPTSWEPFMGYLISATWAAIGLEFFYSYFVYTAIAINPTLQIVGGFLTIANLIIDVTAITPVEDTRSFLEGGSFEKLTNHPDVLKSAKCLYRLLWLAIVGLNYTPLALADADPFQGSFLYLPLAITAGILGNWYYNLLTDTNLRKHCIKLFELLKGKINLCEDHSSLHIALRILDVLIYELLPNTVYRSIAAMFVVLDMRFLNETGSSLALVAGGGTFITTMMSRSLQSLLEIWEGCNSTKRIFNATCRTVFISALTTLLTLKGVAPAIMAGTVAPLALLATYSVMTTTIKKDEVQEGSLHLEEKVDDLDTPFLQTPGGSPQLDKGDIESQLGQNGNGVYEPPQFSPGTRSVEGNTDGELSPEDTGSHFEYPSEGPPSDPDKPSFIQEDQFDPNEGMSEEGLQTGPENEPTRDEMIEKLKENFPYRKHLLVTATVLNLMARMARAIAFYTFVQKPIQDYDILSSFDDDTSVLLLAILGATPVVLNELMFYGELICDSWLQWAIKFEVDTSELTSFEQFKFLLFEQPTHDQIKGVYREAVRHGDIVDDRINVVKSEGHFTGILDPQI